MITALPPLVDTSATRNTLHRLAEDVLAAEQTAANGDYRLDVTPGGFATRWFGDAAGGRRRIRIEGGELVRETETGAHRAPITGEFDAAAAAVLYAWWEVGAEVLAGIALSYGPRASEVVLYPEHFDVASTLDLDAAGRLNIGFSPGDDFSAAPYVYAGPWVRREGSFWNAPFGVYRRYDEFAPVSPVRSVRAFLDAAITEFVASTPMEAGQ
jgi:hypothetical protein